MLYHTAIGQAVAVIANRILSGNKHRWPALARQRVRYSFNAFVTIWNHFIGFYIELLTQPVIKPFQESCIISAGSRDLINSVFLYSKIVTHYIFQTLTRRTSLVSNLVRKSVTRGSRECPCQMASHSV